MAQPLERAVSVDLANLAIERIAKVLPVFSVSVCHGRTIPLRGFHLKQPDVRGESSSSTGTVQSVLPKNAVPT